MNVWQAATRASKLWNNYWFPYRVGIHLALTRIVGCALILLFAMPPIKWTASLLTANDEFVDPCPLIEAFEWVAGANIVHRFTTWQVIHTAAVVSGIMAIVGVFTRISVAIYALCYLLLISHLWSYGEIHHPEVVPCWFLLILSFSRCGDRLSLDALWFGDAKQKSQEFIYYEWPIKLLLVSVAWGYWYSGAWKLFYQGGIEWMNGHTLKFYMLTKGVDSPGLWISQNLLLCVVLSVITIAFELLSPLVLIVPRCYVKYWLAIAFSFHLGNTLLRQENPMFLLWPLLLFTYLLPPDIVRRVAPGDV